MAQADATQARRTRAASYFDAVLELCKLGGTAQAVLHQLVVIFPEIIDLAIKATNLSLHNCLQPDAASPTQRGAQYHMFTSLKQSCRSVLTCPLPKGGGSTASAALSSLFSFFKAAMMDWFCFKVHLQSPVHGT